MSDVRGSVWSETEIDLIVADYFTMLADELAGRPFSKSEHNRAIQTITGRNHASVEFKHCNVSAVLERLGMPTIRGYRSRANFQNSLIDAVDRYLAAKGEPILSFTATTPALVRETNGLWISLPPEIVQDRQEPERLQQLVRKFDPAARDARNRKLGKQGEELVFMHEQQRLRDADRADLAQKIEWTSEVRGDGAGYDIRSFELDGRDRLIEVKTTNGPAKTPFFLSGNERAFSEERADAFRLMRLYSFFDRPSAYELKPPLIERLAFHAMNYCATLI